MASTPDDLTVAIMARWPSPGRVKTRLITDGFFDARRAADLAEAMLECTLARLGARFRVVFAATLDAGLTHPFVRRLQSTLSDADIEVIDQGSGDLGERLDHVWRRIGSTRPIAFIGADTPDVPATHLHAILRGLMDADIAVGPTDDGGYWTLAARSYRPQVLRGIDWGSDSVYDSTRRRARESGLSVHELPMWRDVDRPEDVWALRRRLDRGAVESGMQPGMQSGMQPGMQPGMSAASDDAAFARLAGRLGELLAGMTEAANDAGTARGKRDDD